MDKQDIQHWSGEGLPPVGTVCEINLSNRTDGECWHKVAINYASSSNIVALFSDGIEIAYSKEEITERKIRPIRTPEQIEAERRSKVIASMSQLIVNKCHSDVAALDIYDAIRAGKIEGVKIDG
ncbi:hypothetical protein [Serratia fonticola]|uniref:hypothetical protein n=1 Tax=Serratia fonticola TaxID=47917 RepID=UPI00093C3827|nr:hypothetical protein [Serratia fonticola]OKP29408.1 hypothetical protein BSQ40_09310 [Serratia fonticola]